MLDKLQPHVVHWKGKDNCTEMKGKGLLMEWEKKNKNVFQTKRIESFGLFVLSWKDSTSPRSPWDRTRWMRATGIDSAILIMITKSVCSCQAWKQRWITQLASKSHLQVTFTDCEWGNRELCCVVSALWECCASPRGNKLEVFQTFWNNLSPSCLSCCCCCWTAAVHRLSLLLALQARNKTAGMRMKQMNFLLHNNKTIKKMMADGFGLHAHLSVREQHPSRPQQVSCSDHVSSSVITGPGHPPPSWPFSTSACVLKRLAFSFYRHLISTSSLNPLLSHTHTQWSWHWVEYF